MYIIYNIISKIDAADIRHCCMLIPEKRGIPAINFKKTFNKLLNLSGSIYRKDYSDKRRTLLYVVVL